jgi:hypothetical protein
VLDPFEAALAGVMFLSFWGVYLLIFVIDCFVKLYKKKKPSEEGFSSKG